MALITQINLQLSEVKREPGTNADPKAVKDYRTPKIGKQISPQTALQIFLNILLPFIMDYPPDLIQKN